MENNKADIKESISHLLQFWEWFLEAAVYPTIYFLAAFCFLFVIVSLL